MRFKLNFILILFVLFAGLCGYELNANLMASARNTTQSVRYVRSIENPGTANPKADGKDNADQNSPGQTPGIDLDEILKHTDLDG
ncbi:MAG: hypothetical protein KKC20_10975 [Proteobacteria bacterium]|nr:hypothetical protein [Pseudomonadota bacterium]